ncbi:MAG: VWA domain-containing protein [Spirochaetota bacterium]
MSFQFYTPLAFVLLAAVSLAVWLTLTRERRGTVRYSSTSALEGGPHSPRERLHRLPLVLRTAALVLLVVALARPRSGSDPIRNVTEGVAIQMVLDISGSMKATMDYRGERASRLEVAKTVLTDFVAGDGREMGGRPDDLVGIVTFAGHANTISPLTHSHDALLGLLDEHESGGAGGTAIGDAIALGAARLKTAEEELELASRQGEAFTLNSKILILLTDGEHNAGKRTPSQAAALAAEWGIKLYTIGIIPKNRRVTSAGASEMLQRIAEQTGGIHRVVHDERGLRAVYEEIDRLEKTQIESLRYLSTREYFAVFALAALGLLVMEGVLSRTVLRRLP